MCTLSTSPSLFAISKFANSFFQNMTLDMMSHRSNIGNPTKKPDNIIWIEEVILNNLEENGIGSPARVDSVQNSGTPSKNSLYSSVGDGSSDVSSKSKLASAKASTVAQAPSYKASITNEDTPELKIGIAEIELKDESYLGDDRVQTLSRIVTGKIKYFIENNKELDDEERYQYWIIKLPSLMNPNRSLSQMMDVARREINFYTEILPNMKSWLEAHSMSQIIDFRVPTCFYGKYLRPVDPDPELDIITHILDSESLLVLDDLRASGFGKRHFGSGLLISEAAAALEAIVKFHVTSWAMQTIDKKSISNWPHLYDWQNIGHLYHGLLETHYSDLQKFLQNTRHPKAHEIHSKLLKLRPQLLNKLFNMLVPADANSQMPNTLIHMDFWSDNLVFRMTDDDKENQVPMEEADLDCYILDWQMVSYGKPTHDLAILTMISMEPSYRREHATWLLQFYYQLFEQTAGYFGLEMPFDFQTLKQEYKQSCVLATFMAMASIEMVRMEETTQNRLMEALLDLIDDNLL